MSLGYLLKDIAQMEMGLMYKYSRNYLYIFVEGDSIATQYQWLHKRMKHWTIENIKKTFSPKEDDSGKLRMVKYQESMPCYLPTASEKYPTIKNIVLVPKTSCKNCVHKKYYRKKPFCELIRAKNKGLLVKTLNDAVNTANEILGKVTK